MNLQAFFKEVGGDYESVLSRLPSEQMIQKFLRKFPNDPSFSAWERACEENDANAAFLAVHTLKGTAANLGLDALAEAASELTEQLREAASFPEKNSANLLKHVYQHTIDCIRQLD